jgi:PPOX class probable F420-dependent enzyme
MESASKAMGHGIKQRDRVRMTDAEVTDFISTQRTMTMATVNADASIHLVAMWYGVLDGKVVLESKTKAQKVMNLRRNPAMSVLVEAGDTYDQLRGVQIAGTATIIEGLDAMWSAGVAIFERYNGPYTPERAASVEAMLHKRVIVELHPTRVTSWDHRKLGLPPMPANA